MTPLALNRYPPTADPYMPGGMPALVDLSISDADMAEFIRLIYEESGIVLAPQKKAMISSRLYKRLRALNLISFHDYLRYIRTAPNRESEIVRMVSEITTNKTAFFRESHHFEFLVSTVLPKLVDRPVINIWSAGCSTGEEPYTLAMVLTDYFGSRRRFNILAIDLSGQALSTARLGVYSNGRGTPIPAHLRNKYTLRGCGRQSGRFRIVPELRERVRFGHFNLMDRHWDIPAEMDIIFCRNVMIYFDRLARSTIVSKFAEKLRDGGHFFIGHSETLSDLDTDFVPLRPTVYTKGPS